jgi:hypothetical protein
MPQIILFSDCNNALGYGRYAAPYRLATELRNNGYTVRVIDFFASYDLETLEKILKTYIDKSTLFVGFSTSIWTKSKTDKEKLDLITNSDYSMRSFYGGNLWTPLFPQSNEFIDELFLMIKKLNSKCKIVVGGYKANHINQKGVDFWVLGQGETSIIKIANHLYRNDSIDGIKTKFGLILTDKIYPYNNFSSSQILFEKSDFLIKNENIPIETARGCIFSCSFCSFNLNGKKFGDYTKSKETLREELVYNYENFGINEYMISDDTFNDSIQKIEYFYDVISNLPFKIKFSCHLRLDILGYHMEMAHMLKDMGAKCVEFGIETMNIETGKKIGKLGDKEKIIQILHDLKSIWKDDVYMSSGFVVGLPYETEKSIRDTMEWLYSDDNPLTAIQFNQYAATNPPILPIESYNDVEKLGKAGFVNTPRGWIYENISKIADNPAKYGYVSLNNIGWKNNHMDSSLAAKIEQEFHEDTRARKKKNLSVFHHYNRIRNLGFSHEEIKNLYYDDVEFVKTCIKRSNTLIKYYLNKIL